MNILQLLKKGGSGIHIKEKNKGSFTRWCGGNVTEECIRRGKASSNPKIRKKATFADNARHFKHKLGGLIMQEGGKFNWGLLAVNAGSNLLSAISENTKASAEALKLIALNSIDFNQTSSTLSELKSLKALNDYLKWLADYKSGATFDLPSSTVTNHLGYLNFAKDYAKAWEDLKNKNKTAETEAQSKKTESLTNAISGIALSGIGLLAGSGNNNLVNLTLTDNEIRNSAREHFDTLYSQNSMSQSLDLSLLNSGNAIVEKMKSNSNIQNNNQNSSNIQNNSSNFGNNINLRYSLMNPRYSPTNPLFFTPNTNWLSTFRNWTPSNNTTRSSLTLTTNNLFNLMNSNPQYWTSRYTTSNTTSTL